VQIRPPPQTLPQLPQKLALAQQLYDAGQTDIATICQTLGISRATLYRALADRTPEPRQ